MYTRLGYQSLTEYAQDFVGSDPNVLFEHAGNYGLTVRIAQIDDKSFERYMNFKPNRLTVRLITNPNVHEYWTPYIISEAIEQ